MRRATVEGGALPSVSPGGAVGLELDPLDHGIIRHLQDDGRRPYREIGRELGVSEGTIRSRVRRLTEAEALRVVAIADPFHLGYRVLAFVLVAVEPGANEKVIDALVGFPEVTYVSACTGRFDVYIQVVCRDHDHLYELLAERIPAVGGIVRTETFTELKMYKVSYRYPALDGPTAPARPQPGGVHGSKMPVAAGPAGRRRSAGGR
ncbi:MAG: Lrp/AsnC family transcriptional regulator [Acidimicrobiales bacterium]